MSLHDVASDGIGSTVPQRGARSGSPMMRMNSAHTARTRGSSGSWRTMAYLSPDFISVLTGGVQILTVLRRVAALKPHEVFFGRSLFGVNIGAQTGHVRGRLRNQATA